MNKPVFGLLLGGILGIFDGLTAWFTPEARPMIGSIVVGSTIKGLITGLAIGFFSRKVSSVAWGTVFGLGVGLAAAYGVAAMQDKYYFEIMLPGGILGLVVGAATQKFPQKEARDATHSAL
jgi:hypothetical protein